MLQVAVSILVSQAFNNRGSTTAGAINLEGDIVTDSAKKWQRKYKDLKKLCNILSYVYADCFILSLTKLVFFHQKKQN